MGSIQTTRIGGGELKNRFKLRRRSAIIAADFLLLLAILDCPSVGLGAIEGGLLACELAAELAAAKETLSQTVVVVSVAVLQTPAVVLRRVDEAKGPFSRTVLTGVGVE